MSIAPHFGPNNLADEVGEPLPAAEAARPVMRLLVTGWRGWPQEHADYIDARVDAVVGSAVARGYDVVIVHGDADGADHHADVYVTINPYRDHVRPERHPADWKGYGKAAGPMRNTEMVDAGADLCLAFPSMHSRGTIDCMKKAWEAGIPVTVWSYEHCLRLKYAMGVKETREQGALFDV